MGDQIRGTFWIVYERNSRSSKSRATRLVASLWRLTELTHLFHATKKMKEKWVPLCQTMKITGCFAMTELGLMEKIFFLAGNSNFLQTYLSKMSINQVTEVTSKASKQLQPTINSPNNSS